MKKERIDFSRSNQLEDIDTALDEALDRLDATNTRVDELLANFDLPTAAADVAEVPDEGEEAVATEAPSATGEGE